MCKDKLLCVTTRDTTSFLQLSLKYAGLEGGKDVVWPEPKACIDECNKTFAHTKAVNFSGLQKNHL